jgi:predicted secreted protein
MVARAGRAITFEWNNAEILGVREKGLALNGEPIDITSDENDGWRTLLSGMSAQDQVDINLSGVVKDEVLKTDWFAGTRDRTVTVTWPNGDELTGTFKLVNLNLTGPYNDAETFEGQIQSSGPVTFTPYS